MFAPHHQRIATMLACVGLLALAYTRGASAFDREAPPRIHRDGRPAAGAPVPGRPSSAFPDAEPRYHNGAEMECSDCHISHASQSHAQQGASLGMGPLVPYAGTANENLLRANDPLDLCLSCHDGQTFAPDVVGADVNNLQDRSAGHFGQPEQANINGHDLGRGLPKAGGSYDFCSRCHWGTGTQAKVTCIDCHNPHGNGIARNLQWASDPAGTPDLGLFSSPTANNLERYETDNVAFGSLNTSTLREVSNICLDCHHVFSGAYYTDPSGTGVHVRHPTYDSERGDPNNVAQGEAKGTTVPSHWLGGHGSGFGATKRVRTVTANATDFASSHIVDATRNGVFCLSCHKAHGSEQPFGLVFTANAGVNAAGCDQCHQTANIPEGPAPARAAR